MNEITNQIGILDSANIETSQAHSLNEFNQTNMI